MASSNSSQASSAGAGVENSIKALAHPGRRTMLAAVVERECTASELAARAGLSASATSQHLRVLKDAGLVAVRADATRRLYRADLARVAEVAAQLDALWSGPLQRLREAAEAEHHGVAPSQEEAS